MSHALRSLVLALVGCLLVACGGGEGGTTDAFDDLPGVRDAAIRKEALDNDYYGYTAVVDMEADASRDEIVAALDGLATWFKGRGDEDGVRLYVGGGTTTVDDDSWADGAHHDGPTAVIAAVGSHARNAANADLLLHATEVLDAPVTVRSYEWAVTTQEPRALLRKVLADRQLAAVPGLRVAQPWEETGDYWSRGPDFSSTEPLTRQHVTTYDRAMANMKKMRQGRAHLDSVGNDTGVTPRHTDRFPGAVTIRITLGLPDMAGPKSLAADPLEDPRWPLVAAQLDLLRTLPRGSVLSVSLEWGRAPEAGSAARHHGLVELVKEGKVYRSPFWNKEAAAYLAR